MPRFALTGLLVLAACLSAGTGCVLTTEGVYVRRGEPPADVRVNPGPDGGGDDVLVFPDVTPIEDVKVFEAGVGTEDVHTPDVAVVTPDATVPDAGALWTREAVPLGTRDLHAAWVNQRTFLTWVGGERGALARRDPRAMPAAWRDLSLPTLNVLGLQYGVTVEAISGGTTDGGADLVWLACTLTRLDRPSELRGALISRRADGATGFTVRWVHTAPFGGVYFDERDNIAWFTSGDGLVWRLDAGGLVPNSYRIRPASDAIAPLSGAPLGAAPVTLWAGTVGAGVVVVDTTTLFPRFGAFRVPTFSAGPVRDIYTAGEGASLRRALVSSGDIGAVSGTQLFTYRTMFDLRAVFSSAVDLVAVGADSRIVRVVEPSMPAATMVRVETAPPPSVTLNDVDGVIGRVPDPAMAGVAPREAWAVGDEGVVLHFVPR